MPNVSFESQFFIANRRRLRQFCDNDAPIIITANGLLQRNGDTTFRFRQDSNFWYMTGINDQDVILVIDEAEEYLIVPIRDPVVEIFDGQIDLKQLSETSGVQTVLDATAGWKRLTKRLKQTKRAAILKAPASYLEFHGFYTNPARAAVTAKLQAIEPTVQLDDIRQYS